MQKLQTHISIETNMVRKKNRQVSIRKFKMVENDNFKKLTEDNDHLRVTGAAAKKRKFTNISEISDNFQEYMNSLQPDNN